ncbi:MAG: hypothetical protein P4L73_11490 [Caulobacteraceae bacterium]|nr:hypothetical protein [Caulobacteraceae bacterium]
MTIRLLLAASGLFALAAAGSAAAAVPAEIANCPAGGVAVIRISRLTPTGAIAGFNQAVADHRKWYADHGYVQDRFTVAPVLVADPASHQMVPAAGEVMTLHTHAVDVPADKHDAAWNAYVAEYQANSEIIGTVLVCLPN